MDVVYIYKNNTNTNELKYSIRSVVKHLKGFDKLVVVGGHPNWLSSNAMKVFATDNFRHKQMNAIDKIITICRNEKVSDNFILMNDDFFFLEDIHVDDLPNYTTGTIDDKFINSKGGSYKNSLKACAKYLNSPTALNFEVHYPIVINRKKFSAIMKEVPWKNYSIVYRSIYGNKTGLTPTELPKDFKAHSKEDFLKLKDGKFLSTADVLMFDKGFTTWLKETFSEPTKYEVQR